jgi:membrane protein required for colicin V production
MTLLDFSLIVLLLLSALLGAARGLLRIAVGIACCAAAILLTGFFTPLLSITFIANGVGSSLGNSTVVFLGALVVLLALATLISHKILSFRINIADRLLGFSFGLARGLIVATAAFFIFAWLVPDRNHPDWVTGAASRQFLMALGQWFLSLLPDEAFPTRSLMPILMSDAGVIVSAIALSVLVDLLAIVTRWMGRPISEVQ